MCFVNEHHHNYHTNLFPCVWYCRMSEYCFLLSALKFSAKSSHFSAAPTHTNTVTHTHTDVVNIFIHQTDQKMCTHTQSRMYTHMCTKHIHHAAKSSHTHTHIQVVLCACVWVSLINRPINNMRGRDSVSVVVWCFVAGGSCRHTNIPNSNYHLCGHWRLMSPLLANCWLRSK